MSEGLGCVKEGPSEFQVFSEAIQRVSEALQRTFSEGLRCVTGNLREFQGIYGGISG